MTSHATFVDAPGGSRIHTVAFARAHRPWLVFLHSLGTDLSMWDDQVVAFRSDYSILLLDIRGHGRSDASAPPYTMDLLTRDLFAALDSHAIDDAHLVGISLGAMIAMAAVLEQPSRFSSLAVCNSRADSPEMVRTGWAQRIEAVNTHGVASVADLTLQRWFTTDCFNSNPDLIVRVREMILGTSVSGYAGCGAVVSTLDLLYRLPNINIPTLFIVGEQDTGAPVDVVRDMCARVAGASLEVIPSAAHLSSLEQAEDFNSALSRFLGKGSAKARAMSAK